MVLSFDKQKFESYDDIYNHQVEGSEKDVKIDVQLIDEIDPDGTEGMTAFPDVFDNFKEDSSEEKENTNHRQSCQAVRASASYSSNVLIVNLKTFTRK